MNNGVKFVTDPDGIPLSTTTGDQGLSAALDSRVLYALTVGSLASLDVDRIVDGQSAAVTETGRAGSFIWRDGDYSASVASDSYSGVYVAPDGQTGAEGVWVRVIEDEVLVEWFGVLPNTGNVYTGPVQDAITLALSLGVSCITPSGDIIVDDTLVVTGQKQNMIRSSGNGATLIIFRNTVEDKPLFLLDDTSSYTEFVGVRLLDETAGTSVGVKILSTLSTGSANWKNQFESVRFSDFKVGAITTTDDPLDGLTHAWASESLFLYCKFRNCRLAFLNQNVQAVNTNFVSTDIENDDVGEAYSLIRDEAGGGISFTNGSMIGRGVLYTYSYPQGGTNLWSAGSFTVSATRVEARSGHVGRLVEQDFSGKLSSSSFCNINMDAVQVNTFGEEIDLIYYAGRTNANFNAINPLSGKLIVRQFPTLGVTATTGEGSYGSVSVDNSGRVDFVREVSAPSGYTYDLDSTGLVEIRNPSGFTSSSTGADSQGFRFCRNNGHTQLPPNLISGSFQHSLVYHRQKTSTGFSDIKLKLPTNAYPVKLFGFKQPQRFFEGMGFNLYIVKDEADWQGATFDLSTDAEMVATISTSSGEAGYFEAPVVLTSNSFGTSLQSGLSGWEEGRLYLEHVGASNWAGWVGVSYV